MPSRMLALHLGYSSARLPPLNCLCLLQQLRIALRLDHARRWQQWGCSLSRLCGREFAPREVAKVSSSPK